MSFNKDFKEMFAALNACRARYLVVGAHAVMFHTEPRYTKDLDIWVEPSDKNAACMWEALKSFGARLDDLHRENFEDPELTFQIGLEPNRIDVMMGVPGLTFTTAWRNRVRSSYGGVPISVLSSRDIMRAKRAAGRPQDLLDISLLETAETRNRRRKRRSRQ
jgi:hypothetical protein